MQLRTITWGFTGPMASPIYEASYEVSPVDIRRASFKNEAQAKMWLRRMRNMHPKSRYAQFK